MLNFGKRNKQVNNKKKNSIQPIIYAGILSFLGILCICLLHIRTVRNNLKEVISEQYAAQLQIAEKAVCDRMNEIKAKTQSAANETMTHIQMHHSDAQIFQVMAKYVNTKDISQLAYISTDGVGLYADGEARDFGDRMKDISNVEGNRTYIRDDYFKNKEEYSVIHVSPVTVENKKIGIVVALQDCENIIGSETFSNLDKIGNVFIMDREGHILATTYANARIRDKLDTFQSYASDILHMSKKNVDILGANIKNASYTCQTFVMENRHNQKTYYSFTSVGTYEDLVIGVAYSDDALRAGENNLIGSTILMAVIIVVAMLIFVVIILWHSNRAGKIIEKYAFEDEITGGKNLNYFKGEATEILKKYRGMAFSIHRIDIVNFRYINEAYGHEKADLLLRAIEEEAAQIFYSNEIFVRMNADQHVLLTKNTLDLEERIFLFTDKVNARALDIGIRYPIKFKRGVYKIQNTTEDISIMIDKANAARKELTGEEKECVAVYSDKMIRDMRKINMIESSMESAMFNGEFKMFVQPKWDIVNNCLFGGEALVRWIREDGTMVYPSDFVPVFEKNGFVEQLDMYMLECACKVIRQLVDAGKEVYPISVNQSRVLIHNPQYLDKVKELMNRYEIPKESIELEVTETVLFMEQNKMLSIMNSLKSENIPISMDDFGSGYSSLNMLKDFPFDILKIDKEFFSESITSEASILILTKIVEMAKGLGIKVICEGVETKEQVEMLKKIGVQYVQGYYFSRPIPSNRFLEMFCDLDVSAEIPAKKSDEQEVKEHLVAAEKERAEKMDGIDKSDKGNTSL